MAKRSQIQERKLDELEVEFKSLLLACLRECGQGRYGLFGQNDHLDPEGKYLNWPEAKRLKELAYEIKSFRLDFGQPNQTCERYLQLCSLRGANVPGEPKLAIAFLNDIEKS
jgi:hypothetical protein